MLNFRGIELNKVLLSKCKLCNNFEPLERLLSDSLKQKLFVNISSNDFCVVLKSLGVIFNFDGSLKALMLWDEKAIYANIIEDIIGLDVNIGLTHIFESDKIKVYISRYNNVMLVMRNDTILNASYFDKYASAEEESIDYLKIFLDNSTYFLDKETGDLLSIK